MVMMMILVLILMIFKHKDRGGGEVHVLHGVGNRNTGMCGVDSEILERE